MKLSEKAAKELIKFAKSGELRKDMEMLKASWQSPFIKEGEVNADAYIDFVQQYNEFINHAPRPFRKIIDKDIKL
ncbi:MAG: hypothetical protein AB1498_02225 [bacterium]